MKKVLITLPCFNEELILSKTVSTVKRYAQSHFAGRYSWQLLLLDNASRDGTFALMTRLKEEDPERIIIDQVWSRGRGVALRESWCRHDGYDIYAYMDVDLATDLKDFGLLVDKIVDGYDLVTGSRYLEKSDVKRTWQRLLLSRIYNRLIQWLLGVNFQDAQCGFKAFGQRLVAELVPLARDAGWFWDTELMILACRRQYKVLEVPVTWREVREKDRQSTVTPWYEVIKQLKNIGLMRRRLATNYYDARQ